MNKSFEYIAFVDTQKTPGVAKKIESTVRSARKLNMSAKPSLFKPTIRGAISFIKALFNSKSDVILIRFSSLLFPFLFFPLLFARLKGTKIVIDVPTPRKAVLVERKTSEPKIHIRLIKQLVAVLSSSWVLMPANLIVQYANEGRWFEFGVKQKSIKLGNGIDIPANLPIASSKWGGSEKLNLIAVAQLADWHGYDRLVDAMAQLKRADSLPDIHLTIVGEGDAYDGLVNLVKMSELESYVEFKGYLSGEALDRAFQSAHIGVASLGLYRIGLEEASVLKTREYVARGLTVIGAAQDPDFSHDSPIRLMVSNSDSINDISNMLVNLSRRDMLSPEALRDYAESHLSMESKLLNILSRLNK